MNPQKLNRFFIIFILFNLCCLAARMYYTQSFAFRFLIWNTALAYTPFLIAKHFNHIEFKTNIVFYGFLITWLLFLPNAPYMITDIIHLGKGKAHVPKWFDAMLLFSHALCGLLMGLASIYIVIERLKTRWKSIHINFSVMLLSFLIGFGIYLGRFSRWNSWDIIVNPKLLFLDSLNLIVHPFQNPKMVVVVLFFTGLHFILIQLTKMLFK